MQALERRFPDRPAGPGRPGRREFEYTRHGTQSLLCAFEVHRGRVVGDCRATRTAADLVGFMETVAVEYPTGPVHIIWDCLNIHFDGTEQRWTAFNARHGHRFVFHYTPKHASWVNQIELFFSILQRQCVRSGAFAPPRSSGPPCWRPRRLEPRPGPSLPVDFHRLSVASWPRAASGGGRMRGIPRGGGQANPGISAHPGRRRRPASGDPRPRGLRARVGPGGSGASDDSRRRGIPVARATPLGTGQFGLSFHTHTGRWEPMPVVADLTRLATILSDSWVPTFNGGTFPTGKAGRTTRAVRGRRGGRAQSRARRP